MKPKAGDLSLDVLESGSGESALSFFRYWGGSAHLEGRYLRVSRQAPLDSVCPAWLRPLGRTGAGYSIRELALDNSHLGQSTRKLVAGFLTQILGE